MKTFTKVWLGIALIAIGIGVAILVIAVASGASIKDTYISNIPTVSYEDSYSGVTDIDVDIEYGDIRIVEGDTFSIDARNIEEDSLESYVDDNGTWIMTQKTGTKDSIYVFGFRFSPRNIFRWNEDMLPRITITLPRDFIADDFSLNVQAGNVTIDNVHAVTGDFIVDAGRLVVEEAEITKESEYNVGAAQMTLKNVSLNNITVNCDVGDVMIKGDITGDNSVTCDVGNVELDLRGEEENYNFYVSADIGRIDIDGRSYHGISNQTTHTNSNSKYDFTLNCEIGNISVDFY